MTKHLTEDERSHLISTLLLLEAMVVRFPIDRHSGPFVQQSQNKIIKDVLAQIRIIKNDILKDE